LAVLHIRRTTKRKKIALVTGGNSGIGFETCRQLSELGLTVILTSRDPSKGKIATKILSDNGSDIVFYQLDVTNKNNITNVYNRVEQEYGRLDILINNAAILFDQAQSTINVNLDLVKKALTTNLIGPWSVCQAFIPLMKKNQYGRIVNVSSGAGSLYYMEGGAPAYGSSKVALNALTRKLASELKWENILVNSIDPGWVETDMGGKGGRPVVEGCKGIIWAATLPDNGPSGGFYHDQKLVPW
jgi:NAD(P)-dependent dehydrogenase (short-subunit alcohol dehydrogenase family)